MMIKKTMFILLACFPLTSQVMSQVNPTKYELVPLSNSSSMSTPHHLKFSLKYTLGTHSGEAKEGRGWVTYDPQSEDLMKGEFKIPIQSIVTGDKKRDCHMQESLGLNYDQADFPEKHVCDSQDTLPLSGPNSIQYPDITFTLERIIPLSGDLARGEESEVRAFGAWNIHGKKYPTSHEMKLSRIHSSEVASEAGEGKSLLRVKGNLDLSLKDFDVYVKPAVVLGFSIEVKDRVMVDLNFVLEQK